MSSLDSETDDDEVCFELQHPVTTIRSKIIEPITPYNYVQVIVNVIWEVNDFYGDETDIFYKKNLCTQVLNSYYELSQLRSCHWGCIESMYKLIENGKLNQLKKKIGWFQWLYSFIL